MKKKLLSMLLVLVLVLSIAPVTAHAADIEITVNTGEYFDKVLQTVPSIDDVDSIASAYTVGCALYISGSNVCLRGTISSAGDKDFNYTLKMKDGTEHTYYVCVKVRTPDKFLPNASYNYNAGESVYIELNDLSTGGEISNVSFTGKLPKELSFAAYDSYAAISGTAETHGVFNITVKAYDDISQGWRLVNVAIGITAIPVPSKQPTGENIDEGGTAEFVAWANYLQEVRWKLVSPDDTVTIYAKQAASKFTGLNVSVTQATGKLTLSNVPYALNGWKIVAEFWGAGGSTDSNPAKLVVNKVPVKAPEISTQPQSAETDGSSAVVLSVSASSPDGGTLSYQWYKTTNGKNSGGSAIDGAESDKFTPELPEDGSVSYYCVVKNTRNGESKSLASDVAEVTVMKVEASPEPTETPAPEESPEPEASPEPTAVPEKETEETKPAVTVVPEDVEKPDEEKSGSLLWVILAVIICAAVIACIVFFILTRKKEEKKKAKAKDAKKAAAPVYTGKHDGKHLR